MGSDAIYDAYIYILINTIAHTALVKSKTPHSPIKRMRMLKPAHALGRVGCTDEKDILRNRIIVVREYCCKNSWPLRGRPKCIQVFGSN